MTVSYGTALPPDHSDTPDGASDIAPGQTVEGYIDSPNDVDYFRLRLAEPGTISVTIDAEPGIEIAILDADGNVLAIAETVSEATVSVTSRAGERFLRVLKRTTRAVGTRVVGKAVKYVLKKVKINVETLINIIRGIPDYTVDVGQVSVSIDLTEYFESRDGSPLAFRASVSHAERITVTVQRSNLMISEVHGVTPGPVTVTVTASLLGDVAVDFFTVTLREAPNQPPKSVCDPIIQQTVDPGTEATFPLNTCFKDDKPDELGFAVTRVVESSGQGWQHRIFLTDLEVDSAESMSSQDFIAVEVTATDASGESVTQVFRVNLNKALPVMTQFLTKNVDPGGSETIDFTQYFRDPEGSRLTFALGEVPQGLTLRLAGSSLTISASSQAAGGYEIPCHRDGGRRQVPDFHLSRECEDASPGAEGLGDQGRGRRDDNRTSDGVHWVSAGR